MKATNQLSEEIDRSFNPINLDYIFEKYDPISPWIEERENPLLDGVDNSEWIALVSDDGGGGGGNDSNGDDSDGNDGGGTHRYQARCTSQSSTPTPTQSDNSGGLTPSDGGGDDGDSEGTSHGDGSGGGGGGDNGGDGGNGTSFGAGSEDFIGGFGLCDVGEHYDIGELVAPLPQLPRRFRGSDTRRDERRIRSREQQFDSSDSSHSYPYHPYPSYSSDSQSYPYPPQQNYPWPPQQHGPPGYGLPNYQQTQEEYVDPFQPSTFTYMFPTGWDEGSSNQAQQSDSQDAPRHSFWLYAVLLPIVVFLLFYRRRRNVYDLHHSILGLLFAVMITGVLTDTIKNAIGRPPFFWRCFPDGIDNCDQWGNIICHGIDSIIKDGHKSFPSGHTSCLLGFVIATFCYLQFFPPQYHTDGWVPHAFEESGANSQLGHPMNGSNRQVAEAQLVNQQMGRHSNAFSPVAVVQSTTQAHQWVI
ncbi:unnamed protein product [Camellia sinensis]